MKWVWFALLVACSGDDTTSDTTDSSGDDDDVVGDDDDDDVIGPTGSTGDTAPVDTSPTGDTGSERVVDCAALSATPIGTTLLPGLSAYHGLAFDEFGYFYGSNSQNVVKWDAYGAFSIVAPGVGSMEQFDYAYATGMLYVAAGASIREISPGGSQRVVGNVSAYGVKVGPDGMVYAGDNQRMYRIDPVTATQEVYIDSGPWSPRTMDWSPDGSKMYFGNLSGGVIYTVDLDSSYDPVSGPVPFANGFGSYLDGVTVDVCGNVYVASYTYSAMYRISPSGVVSTLMDPTLTFYGHGVQFGSGVGGWLDDALYVPQPYNGSTVSEVIIGVPHRTFTGTVLNVP